MSRTLPTGLAAAFAAAKIYPVFLVVVDWPVSGLTYMWNGYHSLDWNGHTWLPVGHFGGISDIKESQGTTANGLSLSLSGLPAAIITEARRNDIQGKSVQVYFGTLSTAGFVIDPYLAWDGVIDTMPISLDGKTCTVNLVCEKELADNRSGSRKYCHEDQQLDYAGDLFFQFLPSIVSSELAWGKVTSVASASLGPPRSYRPIVEN